MAQRVTQPGEIRPGDVFEDCRYHPCYCYETSDNDTHIFGISLIDGSTWQCNIAGCGLRKLTPAEAWRWKSVGPALNLTLTSGQVIADVSQAQVRAAIENEDSVHLGIDEHYFLRCQKQSDTPHLYVMEYQDGSMIELYETVERQIPLDRVVSAFVSYLRRADDWQKDFQWQKQT